MNRIAPILLLLAGSSYAASANAPLQPSDAESLRQEALKIREAIVKHDVNGILQRVSKSEGLSCTDRRIPYEQVRKDLHDKDSHLYMSLFDSARFSKRCGKEYPSEYPAISDHEFFSRFTNGAIEVKTRGFALAEVILKSRTKGHYQREWLFHKEGRQWRLINGFIVSRCSCG